MAGIPGCAVSRGGPVYLLEGLPHRHAYAWVIVDKGQDLDRFEALESTSVCHEARTFTRGTGQYHYIGDAIGVVVGEQGGQEENGLIVS